MVHELIKASHISKSFGGVKAVRDVSLSVNKGEVHVIAGENGAGKSTFIKILAGVHAPDRGEVHIDGNRMEAYAPYNSIRAGIAPIFQESSVYENQSVIDNVFVVDRLRKGKSLFLDRHAMERTCEYVFHELGEEIDVRQNLVSMSAGRKKIVEIARALVQDAKCVIMDEPTSSLSQREVEKLFKQIELLKMKGISIVYITHKLDEIYAIGDRISVFRDGALVGTRATNELTRNELIRMMIDRTLDQYFPDIDTSPGESVLEVNHLSSHYGLFRDVSFSIRAGEILGFYGLVGAGRSEMAQAIFGIDKNCDGEVIFRGKQLKNRSADRTIHYGIAYLPEDRQTQGLVVKMDVKTNVTLAILKRLTRFGFISKKSEESITRRLVDRLRITTTGPDQVVNTLSGGNQQKVLVSKWLNVEPAVIILDEPTRGIDVATKVEIYHLIKSLSEKGVAVILISSELPEVMGLSQRLIVMNGGKIVTELGPEEISKETIMKAALQEIG